MFLLLSVVFFSILGIQKVAAQAVPTPEKCFDFSQGEITNYKKGVFPECGVEVKIPSQIGGKAVTTIGKEAFQRKALRSVIFPNTLKEIKPVAFAYNAIQNLELPGSITKVGRRSFVGNHMKTLKLNFGLQDIESVAFYNNELTTIEIPTSVVKIGGGAFNNNQLPEEKAFIYVREPDGTEDKKTLISYGGKQRENVIVPGQVKHIEELAFYSNSMKSLTLPSGLLTISRFAFDNNSSLKQIDLSSQVTKIGDYAFFRTNIQEAVLPSSLETLGFCALGCTNNSSGLIKKPTILWKTNGFATLNVDPKNTHLLINAPKLTIHYQDEEA